MAYQAHATIIMDDRRIKDITRISMVLPQVKYLTPITASGRYADKHDIQPFQHSEKIFKSVLVA